MKVNYLGMVLLVAMVPMAMVLQLVVVLVVLAFAEVMAKLAEVA